MKSKKGKGGLTMMGKGKQGGLVEKQSKDSSDSKDSSSDGNGDLQKLRKQEDKKTKDLQKAQLDTLRKDFKKKPSNSQSKDSSSQDSSDLPPAPAKGQSKENYPVSKFYGKKPIVVYYVPIVVGKGGLEKLKNMPNAN